MSYDAATYPFDTVVYLTDTIGSTNLQGSGVLIAPDEVLTASHMLYETGIGTATNIVVHPGYSQGDSQYGEDSGNYIHYYMINDTNDKISTQDTQYDFALIHLQTPITTAGYMGIQTNYQGGQVNVTGYPSSSNGLQSNSIQTVTPEASLNVFNGTTLGVGSSGGPVWIDDGSGPHVVGVISSKDDANNGFFAQLTSADLTQIQAWMQADQQMFPTSGAVTASTTADTITPDPSSLGLATSAQFVASPTTMDIENRLTDHAVWQPDMTPRGMFNYTAADDHAGHGYAPDVTAAQFASMAPVEAPHGFFHLI